MPDRGVSLLCKRVVMSGLAIATVGALSGSARAADGDDVLLEFHFQPVPNAQIAIWLTSDEGTFERDVFVTQATATLGIGNRPGRWDFLSSWRFPYGPRTNVLPVWAHARGKQYPALIFHDDNPADLESLGWHENSSSPEAYFCRPLQQSEHDTISTDTMTCPSPSTFQSDKGQFSGAMTIYPPRADLTTFEDGHDHPDTHTFSELNDLDAVSGATPVGDKPEHVAVMISGELAARGPLTAWLEIHLEDDPNADWTFGRSEDHFVDQRLQSFGIPYLGQPSVVYAVTLDPVKRGFSWTDQYSGYGELDGSQGTLHPPDDTISTQGGSGADRLTLHTRNEVSFRFGVFSHGNQDEPPNPDEPDWGACEIGELPAMTDVAIEPVDFDRVRVHFTVPDYKDANGISSVRVFYRLAADTMLDDDNASSAIQRVPTDEDDMCGSGLAPGVTTWCEVDGLFASTQYQVGIRYEDECSNASHIVAGSVTTPQQQFAVVDGLCFVATAAYGAPWAYRVQALRWFRELYLKSTDVGHDLLRFYNYASPGLADMIAESPLARGLARVALDPLAQVAVAMTAAPGE